MNSAHPLAASARIVGTVVNRKEDPRLLTGDGRYVDDVVVPGMVHAHFVRSDIARGRIVRIDAAAARAATGVIAVLTAAELNPLQQGPMRATPMLGMPGAAPERPLADGDVKFVGDPVALVVAESRALAEDAAELVELDIDPLPPVVDYETAADSRELVHDGERDSNVFSHLEVPGGDDLEAVFAAAPHVIDQTFRQQRYLAVPMEARGVVASWSPRTHEFRVWVSTQSPHDVRAITARITGVPERDIRVTMGDVGGGFGQKAYLARDEQVVILASYHLGRPVKWIEDRRENLMAATSSRNERCRVRLAADADGAILAASFEQLDDCGAYPLSGSPGVMAAMMFPGPYRIPRYAWSATSMFTNTCPRAPYRGPWQAETFAGSRRWTCSPRTMGLDTLELRRRNVLHRAELPYTMPSGMPLVEVSPEETLDQAADLVGYAGFRDAQTGHARRRATGGDRHVVVHRTADTDGRLRHRAVPPPRAAERHRRRLHRVGQPRPGAGDDDRTARRRAPRRRARRRDRAPGRHRGDAVRVRNRRQPQRAGARRGRSVRPRWSCAPR